MRFKMFTPYSQLDLDIIESLGGQIQEIYATKAELYEEEGYPCEFSEIEVDGVVLEIDDGYWLSMDDISMN